MGIQINSNISSLLIRQNLNRVTQQLETSLARVSSGKRINRAADDAVGMSISKRLDSQIRGFQQNIQNVNNGLSISAIAESALSQMNNILDRMRELAVQSASDTVGVEQRPLIQAEINQLIEELQRIAGTTEFNGKNLLDGSFFDARVMTGVQTGQYLTFGIPDVRPNLLGAHAEAQSDIALNLNPLLAGDLQINGIMISPSTADGVSSQSPSGSALAKANAINRHSGQTGVTAEALAAQLTGVAPIGNGSLDGVTTMLSINGVNIGAVAFNATDQGVALLNKINEFTNQTGVAATVDVSGQLVLTAADGRNIDVQTTGGVADELGLSAVPGDVTATIGGGIRLLATKTIAVSGNLDLIGFSPALATTMVDPLTAINAADLTTQAGANAALRIVDFARGQLLNIRTQLGAIQNRLENASAGLALTIENITASNSRIIDTDFAVETAKLAQNQILQEAGLAVLAQANNIPQTALAALLRR